MTAYQVGRIPPTQAQNNITEKEEMAVTDDISSNTQEWPHLCILQQDFNTKKGSSVS